MEYTKSELMMIVNNRMISMEKEIESRDRLEFIGCILIAVCFGFVFFTSHSFWTQTGSVILILSALLISYKLIMARPSRTEKKPRLDRPMKEHLQTERDKVMRQRKLLTNIGWWYILPITVGLSFCTLGFRTGLLFKTVYMACVLALGFYIWKLNQDAISRKIDPVLSEIDEAIEVIESETY